MYQTPIFIVAAVADINLRRISQLNKNVCYGCYTKNGRLLHVCYNVCYSCYKRLHKCCEQLKHIRSPAYRLVGYNAFPLFLSSLGLGAPQHIMTREQSPARRLGQGLTADVRLSTIRPASCSTLASQLSQSLHPSPTRTAVLKAWLVREIHIQGYCTAEPGD